MTKIPADLRVSALRRGVAAASTTTAPAPTNVVYAAVVEMANLGFITTPDDLGTMSTSALTQLIADARKVIGADRDMKPIYPGFPKQVEALDTLTLLIEQLAHYWTAGAFLPDYPDEVRDALPLEDVLRNGRRVQVMPAQDAAREVIVSLVTAPVAMSDDDRALLSGALLVHLPDVQTIETTVKGARNGENIQAFVRELARATQFDRVDRDELLSVVAPHVTNVDHLLRVVLALYSSPAAAQHKDNYELAVRTLADRHYRAVRMERVSRGARRVIVERLGHLTVGFRADALVSRQGLWRTVMRAVHPYDFALTDAQKRAADIVHSNIEYRTLNALVEKAMEDRDAVTAVELLAAHQPGNLLRRAVALLRLVSDERTAKTLADAIETVGAKAATTTLISAYNGILSANDEHARVNRVAGLNNTMLSREDVVKVDDAHVALVADAVKRALREALKAKAAPAGPVAVVGDTGVPLVRRDVSTSDRVMDRGSRIAVAGSGDVLRVFGHWINNQTSASYMDIGVVVLDEDFNQVGVSTWNTWSGARAWSTYSGDKLVYPGDSAAEFIDVKLSMVRDLFPSAKWIAMTVQSWAGWPMEDVDFIAGAMLRSKADAGAVFDARSVVTAFKPTTRSTQAVPFAVDLTSGELVWVDSSNGSTESGQSASQDATVGSIVYDEIVRPRLTFGDLARLWAEAHGAVTVDEPVDRDAVLALLG